MYEFIQRRIQVNVPGLDLSEQGTLILARPKGSLTHLSIRPCSDGTWSVCMEGKDFSMKRSYPLLDEGEVQEDVLQYMILSIQEKLRSKRSWIAALQAAFLP